MFRPLTSALGAVAVFVASLIVAGASFLNYWIVILLAMLIVFFFTAASNTLNDYVDRDSDKKNHPERPIPSGRVKPKTALILSLAIFTICIVASWFINLTCFSLVVLAFAVEILYEFLFKKITGMGNIAIGIQSALTYLFGGYAIGSSRSILILSLLSFFAVTGREIIKDIEDIHGDVYKKTIPRKIGLKKSAVLSSVLLLTAVALSPLPYLLGLLSLYYIPVVAVADLIFVYALIIQMKEPRNARKIAKAAMFIALLAFLFGSFI